MKKRKILHRLLVFVLTIAMLAGICPQGIHIADVPLTLPEVKAADTIGNPKIEEDTTMTAGQKVTWDCIYFGSYPQSEITSKDGSVYNKLKNATSWDNNDTTIDGVKYRRLKGEDATQHAYSGDSEQYYDWNDDYTTYHHFKYEPIKWRVLNKDNNDVFLLSDIALDDQRYNMRLQANMISGMAGVLGKNSGLDTGALAVTIARVIPGLAAKHPLDNAYLLTHLIPVKRAHYAELCLSWLDALSDATIVQSSKTKYKKVVINCPIDVTVYDENNKIVAEIRDDKITDNEEGLEAYIDENGQKIVCIPEDADYKVDLKATDNGTMTYTVMNQNLETNECSQVKSYVDIPIKEGEVYKSTFETDTESSTETLKNVSGDEVQPSIEKGASEDIKKQVNVTAQSGGSVTGGGSYTISEYAKVTAEPETNYTFAGWYENDNLISKEKEYRFCVQNNRNLSAHFSKNANQGTQKPSSNTTKPSGNTTKAPSIKPFKATGKPKQIAAGKKVNLKAEIGLPDSITKQLTWKSSNTKVATVNADGVVTVKKKTGGKKVTITASNDKIKVSASWKVTSMKGIVKKVKITGTKTVKAGKSLKLKANVTATKKANKKLQWTSSNAKYATVNAEGVVKTKKVAKGKTIKITAMATDGSNKKATFKVKVK